MSTGVAHKKKKINKKNVIQIWTKIFLASYLLLFLPENEMIEQLFLRRPLQYIFM